MAEPYAVSALSERDAQQAFHRTLRDTHDLVRAGDAIVEVLGDSAWSDPWVRPNGSRILYRRDAERPRGWLHPVPLLELLLDQELPKAPPGEYDELFPPQPRRQPGPVQRPAIATIRSGRSVYQVSCDAIGNAFEWMRSCGDGWGDGQWSEARPFAIDPRLLAHQQPAPIGFLCRPDLDPENGHSPAELARFVAELDPAGEVRHRVWVPGPVPGGAHRCGLRGIQWLRRAFFEGWPDHRDAGWVVIDAVDGSVRTVGGTFDEAAERWHAELARIRPQPPDEPPPPPLDDEPPPLPEIETPDGKVVVPIAMRITWVPPVAWSWERPLLPERAPGCAVPMAALPTIPDRLALQGFSRAVRQVGDEGEPWSAFLREDRGGWTLVGERAAAMVGGDLDGTIDAAVAVYERELAATWGEAYLRRPREYPVRHWFLSTLAADLRGQVPPRVTSAGWTESFDTTGLSGSAAWAIVRVRAR